MHVHYLYNLHFLEPNRVTQKRAIIGHHNSTGNYRLYRHLFYFIDKKTNKQKPITTDTKTNTAKIMSMCIYIYIYEIKVTYNSSCYLKYHLS